jgi:uncharacterized protein with PhoU and TrkA domain
MAAVTAVPSYRFQSSVTVPTVRNVSSAVNDVIAVRTDGLQRLDGDNRWRMVICREGRVWITQKRDWRDYVLERGDVFIITRRGQVLIEALEEATVEITPSLKTRPYSGDFRFFQ